MSSLPVPFEGLFLHPFDNAKSSCTCLSRRPLGCRSGAGLLSWSRQGFIQTGSRTNRSPSQRGSIVNAGGNRYVQDGTPLRKSSAENSRRVKLLKTRVRNTWYFCNHAMGWPLPSLSFASNLRTGGAIGPCIRSLEFCDVKQDYL